MPWVKLPFGWKRLPPVLYLLALPGILLYGLWRVGEMLFGVWYCDRCGGRFGVQDSRRVVVPFSLGDEDPPEYYCLRCWGPKD